MHGSGMPTLRVSVKRNSHAVWVSTGWTRVHAGLWAMQGAGITLGKVTTRGVAATASHWTSPWWPWAAGSPAVWPWAPTPGLTLPQGKKDIKCKDWLALDSQFTLSWESYFRAVSFQNGKWGPPKRFLSRRGLKYRLFVFGHSLWERQRAALAGSSQSNIQGCLVGPGAGKQSQTSKDSG